MTKQQSLFSPANLAATVQIPPAPKLVLDDSWKLWHRDRVTAEDSARLSMARLEEYQEMLAAVIKRQGGARLTEKEILALIPQDWRDLCGRFLSGSMWIWAAKKYGIEIIYVEHDGGGVHVEYKAQEVAA